MKRSEATPEILDALKDPENIYAFEEDMVCLELGRRYVKAKGWKLTALTQSQRDEVESYIDQEMTKRYGKNWDVA